MFNSIVAYKQAPKWVLVCANISRILSDNQSRPCGHLPRRTVANTLVRHSPHTFRIHKNMRSTALHTGTYLAVSLLCFHRIRPVKYKCKSICCVKRISLGDLGLAPEVVTVRNAVVTHDGRYPLPLEHKAPVCSDFPHPTETVGCNHICVCDYTTEITRCLLLFVDLERKAHLIPNLNEECIGIVFLGLDYILNCLWWIVRLWI